MKNAIFCLLLSCVFGGFVFCADTIDDANKAYNSGDYTKAIEIYKKICEDKDAKACASLGYIYRNGKGVSENNTLSQEFYKKACDLGDKEACTNASW